MKRLWRTIEAALTAAAFAEEGDADTARLLLTEARKDGTDRSPAPRAEAGSKLPPRAVAKGSRA